MKLLFDLQPTTAQYRNIFLKFFSQKLNVYKMTNFQMGKLFWNQNLQFQNFLQLNVLKIKSKINIKRKPNYELGWFHN